MTWAEIDAIGQSGFASQVFSIGDTKDISVSGETLTMEIVGFNHDDLADGGKAAYTFGMKNLMANTRQMNATNRNGTSFLGSDMYKYLRNTVLQSFPEDILEHIKVIYKKTSTGSMSSSVRKDPVKIFLFSINEVAGTQSVGFVSNEEGTQYTAFSNNASRVKKLSNGTGSAQRWWMRSPDLLDTNSFCCVDMYGEVGSYQTSNASNDYGVCFGFCV